MKKIIGAVAALAAVGVVAVVPAQADVDKNPSTALPEEGRGTSQNDIDNVYSPIVTNYEQLFYNNLASGVTVDGVFFGAPTANLNEVWNLLYINIYSDEEINQLNAIVNKAKALVANANYASDFDATTLGNNPAKLFASLPIGTQTELLALAANAKTILLNGRKDEGALKGATLNDEEKKFYEDCKKNGGKSSADTTTTTAAKNTSASGSVVKTTGADYAANLAVFAGLVVASVGVAFVGKKYSTKIGLF